MDVLCVTLLCPETVVNLLINSNNLIVNSFFPMCTHFIWKDTFLSLSFLIALLNWNVLNRSGYRNHPCS